MSYGNQSCLRFSLEESVWFEKGQEVAELLSLSLDPNITIKESDQYVSLCGSLELTGEYRKCEEVEEGDAHSSSTLGKTVFSVRNIEDDHFQFTHYFPLDITIPKNRIQNEQDINIEISSFDYVMPEKSYLKLTADLNISGIYGEQQSTPSIATIQDEEYEVVTRGEATENEMDDASVEVTVSYEKEDDVFQPFEAEARIDPIFLNQQEQNEEVEESGFNVSSTLRSEKPSVFDYQSELEEEEEVITNVNDFLKQQPFEVEKINIVDYMDESPKEVELESPEQMNNLESELTQEDSPNEYEEVIDRQETLVRSESPSYTEEIIVEGSQEEILEESLLVQDEVDQDFELDQNLEQTQELEIEPEPEVSQETPEIKQKVKKSKKKEEVLSITEFFARKEEEDVVKLKICIVQQGDTIHDLAKRYDVNTHQLLKVNNLEPTQDVFEGQVLYIPLIALKK